MFVGEVRGNEVIPLLNAMSQGNDGSMSTIHASSSAGVFRKLALYAAQSPERLDPTTTNLHIAEGVDLVVQLRLTPDGQRFVTSVREVVDADGEQVASNEILRPGPGRTRRTGRADVHRTPRTVGLPRLRPRPAAPAHRLVGHHHGEAIMTTGVVYAAALGAGTGLGLLLILRGIAGPTAEQEASSARPSRLSRWLAGRGPGDGRRLAVAVGVGLVVGVWTRWPVAAVLAAVAAWVLPGLIGPDREHKRRLARIEAIATWTESAAGHPGRGGRAGTGHHRHRRHGPRPRSATR